MKEFVTIYEEYLDLYIKTNKDQYLLEAYDKLHKLYLKKALMPIDLVEIHMNALRKITDTKDDHDCIKWFQVERATEFLMQILIIADVTTKEFKERAERDHLTNFYNRRSLEIILDFMFKTHNNVALAFMDIDSFKRINDTYGHEFGDRVLKAVADVVQKNIRKADYPVRYGGDEFLIIFPATKYKEAESIVERILVDRKNRKVLREKDIKLSVGLSEKKEDSATSPNELIVFADKALYQAKQKTEHKIVLYKNLCS